MRMNSDQENNQCEIESGEYCAYCYLQTYNYKEPVTGWYCMYGNVIGECAVFLNAKVRKRVLQHK